MSHTYSRHIASVTVAFALAFAAAPVAHAQFGRNKVQYAKFDFKVLKTEHFDIYFYSDEAAVAPVVGRMAERWYARLSRLLGHNLSDRQPVILYASHPDFEQTNVVEGELGEGTGGVTEGLKRRVVLPMAASLADTDHVLGHELVHAFQYDMLDLRAESSLPLWFIEGMAEYLSIGPRDPQTAMWLRDAAIENRLPKLTDLDDPRYFPYRFGHAFWAYIGGRWGDDAIGRIMQALSGEGTLKVGPGVDTAIAEQAASSGRSDAISIIEAVTGRKKEDLASQWHAAIRETYGVSAAPTKDAPPPAGLIGERGERGSLNVGPALSPDGTKVAFLSARSRLSIDLFIADAKTGHVIRKLTDTASDPHFESLQFLASAGAWDSAGERLAVATVRGGKPGIAIFDANRGNLIQEIEYAPAGEIFQPTWAPDGKSLAFSAQAGGVTDLFVYDFQSGQVRRLTGDSFADLQPVWSPDGTKIAFVTDRFNADLEGLAFHGYRLATIPAAGGTPAIVQNGLEGNATNPQWSRDGGALFFLSDAGGTQNAWRLDLGAGTSVKVTDELTGVAGITPLSPALSVALTADAAAVTVFRDAGYEIRIIPASQRPPETTRAARLGDLGLLPPTNRTSQVAEQLARTKQDLPAEPTDVQPVSNKLSLVGVGQQIGVTTNSMFGTYVGGGIALQFSDMLGNHLLGTGVSINGGLRDISATTSYINRTSRLNWGVFGERVPLLSGTVTQSLVNVAGTPTILQRTDLFRETFNQGGAMVLYPISRVSRVEFSAAARRISFGREFIDEFFDPGTGAFLGQERTKLPSLDALSLVDTGVALVRDTSAFGATGPVRGERARVELAPTFGALRWTDFTVDYRRYFMPKQPVTLAGRVLHVGRYGAGGEDDRMMPLFLGYSTLVRGYDVNSFRATECTPTSDGSCPEFDRLLGSRILVVNGELRAPAFGIFNGRLDYGPLPIELFGFFDAGVAWTRAQRPSFANGPRDWVASTGVGARVNLFGFAIGEFNLVRPLSRAGRGYMFVFNLRPGF